MLIELYQFWYVIRHRSARENAKVRAPQAVIRGMNSHTLDSLAALTETVAAIRHARGLKNPHDLPEGSPEREIAADAFANDFLRALDAEPSIGAWWPI